MEVIKLKNILDYPNVIDIVDLNAKFSAYDKLDDCVMFTAVNNDDAPVIEISIYEYSGSFFCDNKVSDLLTEVSECIVLSEHYHDDGKMFVYTKEL